MGKGVSKKSWECMFASESLPVVIHWPRVLSCKDPDFQAEYKGISISIDVLYCIYILYYIYYSII